MSEKRTNIIVNNFSNYREYDRQTDDYYATEPKAVKLLLELEKFEIYQASSSIEMV